VAKACSENGETQKVENTIEDKVECYNMTNVSNIRVFISIVIPLVIIFYSVSIQSVNGRIKTVEPKTKSRCAKEGMPVYKVYTICKIPLRRPSAAIALVLLA
jgi:hypothetical protein